MHCIRTTTILLILLGFSFHDTAKSDELLRQKIGQMIIVGFDGTTMPESIRVDLAQRNLGGVVYLGRNCSSPAQMQSLASQIHLSALTAPFIAVDEEGGLVARLNQSNGFSTTYTAYQLGTLFNSPDSTAAQAARMAGWLSTNGFTTNFAPVADVNVNPQSPAIGYYGRSFSNNPLTVAQHAQSFIPEFHARGVLTTLKHFPGHGSAGTDSHLELPDITTTWADSELIPYRTLIAANLVDMVMVGHLYNAHIDSVYPTSLSYRAISGLLRDSLGYQGVVITDDLYAMKAITSRYGYGQAAVLSINAGTDILLYVWNMLNGGSLVRQLIDTIEANVQAGVIAETRINESFERIQSLKKRFLANNVPGAPLAAMVPEGFVLLNNFPNPFNPSTVIRYQLPVASDVRLDVFDLLGREVSVLINERKAAGSHEVTFDGARLSSGVYICRLTAGKHLESRKMLLMK
jgi:beta-N-acetylhexosaminidase